MLQNLTSSKRLYRGVWNWLWWDFCSVACLTSVWSLLAITFIIWRSLFHMDIENAFLNGNIIEEASMKPSPEYTYPSNKVCRLHWVLYGLKHVPRTWYSKFSLTMEHLGFTSSPYNRALFVQRTSCGYILPLLYVDNMIITGNDYIGITKF